MTLPDAISKYVLAGLLIGSLFYLVATGKMPVPQYEQIAEVALAALAGYHARGTLP